MLFRLSLKVKPPMFNFFLPDVFSSPDDDGFFVVGRKVIESEVKENWKCFWRFQRLGLEVALWSR